MSVVRSLLIQVGFKFNKKSQNQVTKATNQVTQNLTKTTKATQTLGKVQTTTANSWYKLLKRNLLLWTGAIFAIKRAGQALFSIADNVFQQNTLARSIGATRNQLVALNAAAREFGFGDGDITKVLQEFNKRLQDTRNGLSNFQDINQRLKLNITGAESAQDVIFQILKSIGAIDNENTRIQEFDRIFGGNGVLFSDLSQDLEGFNRALERNLKESSITALDQKNLEKFRLIVVQLQNSFAAFIVGLAANLVDPINKVLRIWDILKSADNQVNEFLSNLKNESLSMSLERLTNGLNPFGAPVITINNEITIPAGSTAEQAQFMSNEISRTAKSSLLDLFKNIQSDYPRIE